MNVPAKFCIYVSKPITGVITYEINPMPISPHMYLIIFVSVVPSCEKLINLLSIGHEMSNDVTRP